MNDYQIIEHGFKQIFSNASIISVKLNDSRLEINYCTHNSRHRIVMHFANNEYWISIEIEIKNLYLADVETISNINALIDLFTKVRDGDPAPKCPTCGLYIANCEGHTSVIQQEPENFREELLKFEELDDILMSQFKD